MQIKKRKFNKYFKSFVGRGNSTGMGKNIDYLLEQEYLNKIHNRVKSNIVARDLKKKV